MRLERRANPDGRLERHGGFRQPDRPTVLHAVYLHDDFTVASVQFDAILKYDAAGTDLRERKHDATHGEPQPNICGVAEHG